MGNDTSKLPCDNDTSKLPCDKVKLDFTDINILNRYIKKYAEDLVNEIKKYIVTLNPVNRTYRVDGVYPPLLLFLRQDDECVHAFVKFLLYAFSNLRVNPTEPINKHWYIAADISEHSAVNLNRIRRRYFTLDNIISYQLCNNKIITCLPIPIF